jgi:hypothetical protein
VNIDISQILSSALPSAVRCAQGCGATVASIGRTSDCDDPTVAVLRDRGWQVVNGEWTCPADLPEDRKNLPGAMGRRRNLHCPNCGDDRGGPYGHEALECTWNAANR